MPRTTTDLYRRGSASSPRMAHVRIDKDILVHTRGGAVWVAARTGGVSTFSMQGRGKNWWLLPAGSEYPDRLYVVNDHGSHYNWEPELDMPLNDFINLLGSVEPLFQKVS